MIHLEAYSSSIATGIVTPVQISAIKSQIYPLDGSGLGFLVQSLNKVCLFAMQGVNAVRAELQSPTLRKQPFVDMVPVNRGAAFSSPVRLADYTKSPLQLSSNEAVTLFGNQNAAGVQVETAGVWFCDGPIVPRPPGPQITVHATAAVTLSALAWSQVAFTLDTGLDPGTYDIIGMRAFSATGLLARVVPNIGGQVYRSGVTMVQAYDGLDMRYARNGELGVFAKMSTTNLPAFELFATSADAAEELWLDLVYTSPNVIG